MTLSNAVKEHKNALASDGQIFTLLEINIPSEATPIYVTSNNEDVVWNSETWTSFGFEVDDIREESDNATPELTVRVTNVNRAMELYIHEYDTWLKLNAHEPITTVMYFVSSKDLANATPIKSYAFDVSKYSTDAQWASFTLSFENFHIKRFPKNRILRDSCRWLFGSTECGYTPVGAETCNKTLTDCRSYNNSSRFGASPSAGGSLNKVYT